MVKVRYVHWVDVIVGHKILLKFEDERMPIRFQESFDKGTIQGNRMRVSLASGYPFHDKAYVAGWMDKEQFGMRCNGGSFPIDSGRHKDPRVVFQPGQIPRTTHT